MSTISKRKAKKPTVSIVGSGRLGMALARALASKGYRVNAVVARSQAHARQAAKFLKPPVLSLSAKQLSVLPSSQIILITVPDGEILNTANAIAKAQASSLGRTVLHTSGALAAAEVLAPLSAIGFATGSLHPLVSVSEPRTGAKKLRGAFYCLEGDPKAMRSARAIVKDLAGHAFHISAEDKPLYHAAAVMASGHVTALVDVATDLLVQCGLDKRTARRVLMPLLESTVMNLSVFEAAAALTGTFARGDLDTVKRHLKALADNRSEQALAVYKLLGRHSLYLAQQRIESTTRKEILRELE